ncbi:SDR family oxidoreductase [Streptomyces wuyuanensis]|uniref:SDR family oxidoreductase n=1 Tax=Streptomyces wuyuanensis TaxID=1196353 RepID=UPI001FCDD6AF|nr:SDR family oxidoreductase [Streptomyces wuyuanensis]
MADDSSSVAYAAAKHGVIGLTRFAALDAARESVRVNALVTGLGDTPLWRRQVETRPESESAILAELHGRPSRRREVDAAFAAFLLSDENPSSPARRSRSPAP